MRIEAKCPCCNKLIYINLGMQDKHLVDIVEIADKKERELREAREKSLLDSMTDEQKVKFERLKAKITKDLFGGD